MNISENGLHIINGLSAAGCWKQAFHMKDRLLINQDILSCGPMTHCLNLKAWEELRIHYLKKLYIDWEDVNFIGLDCDLLNNAEKMKVHDSIFIWVGTGLQDQLLILFVIYLADVVGADTSKIKLIQFDKYPNKNFSIRTMGWINPENMRNHPTPTSLALSDTDNFRFAWNAIISSNPTILQQYISINNSAYPHMLEALQSLQFRYPQRKSGLLYWDWRLLKNCQKHGPSAARIIGHTMAVDLPDDGDIVGDLYLFYRLRELANKQNPKPLIELHGTQSSFRDTTVTLTEFGQSVAEGRESSYPTNPVDEWIGGVHLSSEKGNLWFYENGRLELAKND